MDGKQLKNSILQWAIQGKLVPQNPKDEPAQKLLERIAAARNEYSAVSACHPERSAKGTKSKDLKKKTSKNPPSRIYRENGVWYEQVGNAEPKDISDDIPFEIPENWVWCRLGDVLTDTSAGKSPQCENRPRKGNEWGVIKTTAIQDGYFLENENKVLPVKFGTVKKEQVIHEGDLLITRAGPRNRTGILCLVEKEPTNLILSDKTVRLSYIKDFVSPHYLISYLRSLYGQEEIIKNMVGMASSQVNISQDKMKTFLIPLPPLAEQKRIVAKLEQVLPLAEEYGAAQEQLDKLNKELPEALKKSILQEAIQGKLVPQNPKDEPAQILLERIAASRNESSLSLPKGTSSTSLRGAKATKQSKNPPSRIYRENGVWYEQIGNAEPKDITDEIPFDIPTSWVWCRLKRVCCDFIVPQRDKPTKFNGCIPWCRIEDIEGKFLNGSKSNQLVTIELADSMNMHLCPKGTVICACSASIGNQAITTVDCYTNQTFIGVVCEKEALYNEYLYYFMMSQKQNLKDLAKGTTIGYISRKKFEEYIFPLPPLAEQKRIVAKLEQLFKVL